MLDLDVGINYEYWDFVYFDETEPEAFYPVYFTFKGLGFTLVF